VKDVQKLIEVIPEENRKNTFIIAMDEVGRGSFFGPVSIGGVLFSLNELLNSAIYLTDDWQKEVKDSKKLKAPVRSRLALLIEKKYPSHVSHVSVGYINQYNINRAIQYGVYRTARNLISGLSRINKDYFVPFILLDGNYRFQYPALRMKEEMPSIYSIVKGDDKVFHISCASIIAKEKRDAMIQKSSLKYVGYGFEKNAGYGTLEHRTAISSMGPTRLHRKEYIRNIPKDTDFYSPAYLSSDH